MSVCVVGVFDVTGVGYRDGGVFGGGGGGDTGKVQGWQWGGGGIGMVVVGG